jgi:general secretion pathway protein H
VVLAILGMALTLIAPDLRRSLDSLRYRAAARELAATLRYARSQAVHTRDIQEVVIDSRKGVYTLSPEKNGNDGEREASGEKASGASYLRRKGKLPPGLTLKREKASDSLTDEGTMVISFFPKGGSSGGSFILSGNKVSYRLTVDEITGEVRISAVEK